MRRRTLALVSAVTLSFCIHLAAALLLQAPEEKGAQGFGSGGIAVSLGQAGREPGSERSMMSEAETRDHDVAVAANTVLADTVQPTDETHIDTAGVVDTPPAEVPEAIETIPTISSREVEEHADPRGVVDAESAARSMQEDFQATESNHRSPQFANLAAGQGGHFGTAGLSEIGNGDDMPGGGTPGVTADYYTQLQAWLEKHKRYPRRAKLRNERGIVLLRFVVTSVGEVTDFGIEKSSGYSLLDEEVRKMIRRAQPLPKMPPEMRKNLVEVRVPVRFFLR